MELVNFLLNLVGWFIWAGAFVFPRYAIRSSQPLTLLSTLRSESPQSYGRLFLVAGLVLLIFLRAVAYWNFSPSGSALPAVDFGVLSVSFRADSLVHMICYSLSSFLVFIYVYYLCVFGLSMTCRQRTRVDSIESLVNQQLGSAAYWHPGLKLTVTGGLGALIWILVGVGLIRIQALPEAWSLGVVVLQSPLVAASLWSTFFFIILAVIGIHFLNSYVYLGEKVLWGFIDETAKFYLLIFRNLPLLVGKFDFAPILGFLTYWLLYKIGDA
ncbi:YggT family protein, partial [Verrucomicrobia bacterium]|nr:YggT family protein [Verrucomicrobiota bacterium]